MKRNSFTKPSSFHCKRERWRLMRGTSNTKAAFTLAEVLITLAIVGVVAAMTIPTLIAKINSIVTDNQQKVFKAKMVKGFNLTKTAGDLNNTYNSTYEFLTDGLSKHLKLIKICDKEHIRDCVPYDNIAFVRNEAEETFAVNKLKTAHSLNLSEDNGFKDTAAFVLGDGTVVIGSYKQDCIVDTEELDKEISSCFDGLYDLNGTRKPNKLGQDILPIHTASINAGPAVLATIGGVKLISNAAVPTGVSCSDYIGKEGFEAVTQCYYNNNNDRWVGAIKACKEAGGRLPTKAELTAMASELYNTSVASGGTTYADLDTSKIPVVLSGIGSSWRFLWSGSEYNDNSANYRGFNSSSTETYALIYGRSYSSIRAICVAD